MTIFTAVGLAFGPFFLCVGILAAMRGHDLRARLGEVDLG